MRTRANGASIGRTTSKRPRRVQTITANYSAEHVQDMAGRVRFVAMGGGSDFHGSIYECVRNNALDANTWPGTVLAARGRQKTAAKAKVCWLWSVSFANSVMHREREASS